MASATRTAVIYAIGLAVVWLAMPYAWAGARAGLDALASPEERQLYGRVGDLLQRHGVAPGAVPDTLYGRVQMAGRFPSAQRELEGLVAGRAVTRVSWLGLALIVGVVVFGAVSAVCCYVALDHALVGAIPLAHFFIADPIQHFSLMAMLDSRVQAYVLLGAELAACYLFGAIADSIATERNVRRWKRDE
jgi:hypothetical protein